MFEALIHFLKKISTCFWGYLLEFGVIALYFSFFFFLREEIGRGNFNHPKCFKVIFCVLLVVDLHGRGLFKIVWICGKIFISGGLESQLRESVLPVLQTMGVVRRADLSSDRGSLCPTGCQGSPEPELLFLSPLNLQKVSPYLPPSSLPKVKCSQWGELEPVCPSAPPDSAQNFQDPS